MKEQKENFTIRTWPSLMQRMDKIAALVHRSRTNLIETVLLDYVQKAEKDLEKED